MRGTWDRAGEGDRETRQDAEAGGGHRGRSRAETNGLPLLSIFSRLAHANIDSGLETAKVAKPAVAISGFRYWDFPIREE
jgi:hypothetical protein